MDLISILLREENICMVRLTPICGPNSGKKAGKVVLLDKGVLYIGLSCYFS